MAIKFHLPFALFPLHFCEAILMVSPTSLFTMLIPSCVLFGVVETEIYLLYGHNWAFFLIKLCTYQFFWKLEFQLHLII